MISRRYIEVGNGLWHRVTKGEQEARSVPRFANSRRRVLDALAADINVPGRFLSLTGTWLAFDATGSFQGSLNRELQLIVAASYGQGGHSGPLLNIADLNRAAEAKRILRESEWNPAQIDVAAIGRDIWPQLRPGYRDPNSNDGPKLQAYGAMR